MVHERLPKKLAFVVRKLFYQYRNNFVFLFEGTENLDFELKQVVLDSKNNRACRRDFCDGRRSRRGKRAKRSK